MKALTHSYFWQLACLLIFNGLIFSGTNAQQVPSIILMVGLISISLTFYHIAHGLLMALKIYGVQVRHGRRLATYVALLAGALLAWQSMGQLHQRDVIVLLPLLTVGYLYKTYNPAARRRLPS